MTTNKHNIIIKFNKNDPSIEESKIQHLPFNLLYNGFARVSNYLKVNEKTTPNKNLLYSSFRGVKLVGENLEIPNGFHGLIFRDDNLEIQDDNGNNERQWETISKFQNLIYWNRETIPSDFDKPVQAFKSLNILSMLNKEITLEEIENEINSNKENNKGSSNTTTVTRSTPTKTTTTTTTTTSTSKSNTPNSTPTKTTTVIIEKSNSDLVEDLDFHLDDGDHNTLKEGNNNNDDSDENEDENKRKQKKIKK